MLRVAPITIYRNPNFDPLQELTKLKKAARKETGARGLFEKYGLARAAKLITDRHHNLHFWNGELMLFKYYDLLGQETHDEQALYLIQAYSFYVHRLVFIKAAKVVVIIRPS